MCQENKCVILCRNLRNGTHKSVLANFAKYACKTLVSSRAER